MKTIKNALLLFLFTGCDNNTSTDNSTVQNSSANNIATNQSGQDPVTPSLPNNGDDLNLIQESQNIMSEEELSSFSTDILTDDENRENNIKITCSKLNEYVIEPGETFSFTDTVGKATYEDGYEKANVFDANGNTIKGLRRPVIVRLAALYIMLF